MPVLTRRRSPDAQQETWLVYYGDLHVGTISERAGVPADADQWSWAVGFYPASHRGVAWHWLLPKLTEADFTEYRRQRAMDA